MMRAFVDGVGLIGPGLPGWAEARAVLSGQSAYAPAEVMLPRLEMLPPAERRRTGAPVRLALSVGEQALSAGAASADALFTVFTASGGDGEVVHEICETLAGPDRQVSPTRFHNSVHNAPAGYWGIAMQSHASSTSLCCYDWSFAAGLLEALTQVVCGAAPVLLVSYEVPYPEPIRRARSVLCSFGVALLLAPTPSARSLAELGATLHAAAMQPTRMQSEALERVRAGNPSARSLPLLQALARATKAEVTLDYLGDCGLRVEVLPC